MFCLNAPKVFFFFELISLPGYVFPGTWCEPFNLYIPVILTSVLHVPYWVFSNVLSFSMSCCMCFFPIMEKIPLFSFISLSSAPKCFIYFCHLISFLSDHVSALHILFHRGDCTCHLFLIHGNIFSFTTWQHFW